MRGWPVGAENGATSCDLGVFVDQAAEPIPAQDAYAPHFRRRVHTSAGRVLLQRPVRRLVIGILAQDKPQVPLARDQHPIEALAAGAAHPAFRDRVRTRRLDRSLDDPHADRGEANSPAKGPQKRPTAITTPPPGPARQRRLLEAGAMDFDDLIMVTVKETPGRRRPRSAREEPVGSRRSYDGGSSLRRDPDERGDGDAEGLKGQRCAAGSRLARLR